MTDRNPMETPKCSKCGGRGWNWSAQQPNTQITCGCAARGKRHDELFGSTPTENAAKKIIDERDQDDPDADERELRSKAPNPAFELPTCMLCGKGRHSDALTCREAEQIRAANEPDGTFTMPEYIDLWAEGEDLERKPDGTDPAPDLILLLDRIAGATEESILYLTRIAMALERAYPPPDCPDDDHEREECEREECSDCDGWTWCCPSLRLRPPWHAI